MEHDIVMLIDELISRSVCEPSPSEGRPQTGAWELPIDAGAFYDRFGGALIFGHSEYPTRILAPEDVIATDELMWDGEPAPDDSSSGWFVIADDASGNYVSVDLTPSRLGWCYDTQLGRYGSPGDCPVIARSLTEFLKRTSEARGGHYYWLEEDFVPYGDAYDNVES